MLIKGTPEQVYNELALFLEKQEEDSLIYCYFLKKETKEMRSLLQNNFFHGLFGEIAKHLGENIEDIKHNFLKGLFGTKTVKLGRMQFENAIKASTTELSKEEAIFLIESILKFIEKYKVPCKYTSMELQSLFNSYE